VFFNGRRAASADVAPPRRPQGERLVARSSAVGRCPADWKWSSYNSCLGRHYVPVRVDMVNMTVSE
ncbi:MAG TPA: hypothetical protein PK112_08305, partial [candidate division Zixibacteria bacterium]|nr:hypothetical protein [candidate division Zixibacteria bacterium]